MVIAAVAVCVVNISSYNVSGMRKTRTQIRRTKDEKGKRAHVLKSSYEYIDRY